MTSGAGPTHGSNNVTLAQLLEGPHGPNPAVAAFRLPSSVSFKCISLFPLLKICSLQSTMYKISYKDILYSTGTIANIL